MRRKLRFPEHPSVTTARNVAYLEAMAGRKLPEMQSAIVAPPKPRAAPRQLEAPVLAAVSDLLRQHPKVAYALRINSGMASYEAKSGKYAPVHFHSWLRSPVPCRMPDIFGMLMDGRTLALEIKAPGFVKPRDQREREQWAFLYLIRNMGGVGEFITDAAQVAAILAD